jgi:hypothetical protein
MGVPSLLLLLLIGVGALQVPADWEERVAAGVLLFNASLPADPNLNATIGNGFLATAVGIGWIWQVFILVFKFFFFFFFRF